MRSRRTLSRAGLASAVLVLTATTAVACSGSGEATGQTTCDSPGVSADEIRFGFIYPDTGHGSEPFTAARAGVDARVGLANEQGGINGRHVVYEWRDDASTPATASQVARDLVERSDVLGLVMTSTAASGPAAWLSERGVPVTGLDAEPVWSQYANMFAFVHPTNASVDTWGRYVQKYGGSRAVILVPGTAAASGFGDQLSRSLQAVGVADAGRFSYTSSVDSPGQLAQRIAASGADSIISILEPTVLAEILTALRAGEQAPTVTLSVTGYDAVLLERLGAGLAGVSVALHYNPLEAGGPGAEQFATAMSRYAPQIRLPQQEFALMSYIQTDMLLHGIATAGPCPTREGVLQALADTADYDAGGLIKPTDLGDRANRPQTCLAFVRVNNAGTAFDVIEPELCGSELTS